jgi:uncharacterized glyoxalase superfamily protein PhnB
VRSTLTLEDDVASIADQDYGGRLYSCRDPEGHLWSFGSYDPWVQQLS